MSAADSLIEVDVGLSGELPLGTPPGVWGSGPRPTRVLGVLGQCLNP